MTPHRCSPYAIDRYEDGRPVCGVCGRTWQLVAKGTDRLGQTIYEWTLIDKGRAA